MEIAVVLTILAVTLYLFVSERFPASLVAMMMLCALMMATLLAPVIGLNPARWITTTDCLMGFSSSAALSVVGMFILSSGLQRTGAVAALADRLSRLKGPPALQVLPVILIAGVASAFINNTAAVAIFLPVLVTACARTGLAPSKVMIPLSYASQIGGVCTLIGTSTNLLVADIVERAGLTPLGMFEFAPLGLVLSLVALAYFAVAGRFLLPERRGGLADPASYQVASYLTSLTVLETSRLCGTPLSDLRTRKGFPELVIGLRRDGETHAPTEELVIRAGDTLFLKARAEALASLAATWGLRTGAEHHLAGSLARPSELAIAETLVAPNSSLVDRSLAEYGFASRHSCMVVGLHRPNHEPLSSRLADLPLRPGDALLVVGSQEAVAALRRNPDFLMLDRIEEPALRRSRMPLALGIFALSLLLASLSLVPVLFALLLGAVLLIATRCLSLEEAFEAVDWKVIAMLACMLPLGKALANSGAADILADWTGRAAGPLGPYGALALLYLATALLTEVMSNNATAVLLSPVAIAVATSMGASPRPLLIAVCFAASTSFCSPVGYQTNAMVQHPGGYRFTDYVRAGAPLNLLFLVVSVLLIPLLWPFGAR